LKSQRGYQSDSDYSSANTTPEKAETSVKPDYHMQNKFPSGGIESKTNLIINYLPPVSGQVLLIRARFYPEFRA